MNPTAEQIARMQLKSFEELVNDIYIRKRVFNLTTKNPFTTMNDLDWIKYVETHQPQFTAEPHYELVPWAKLQQLEVDARNAGWELILRTTNNTAYCPAHVGQQWCQRTQWVFGMPGMQFLIHLTYNEDRYSLLQEQMLKDNDGDIRSIPLSNYFSLEVIVRAKQIIREKTEAELEAEFDKYLIDDEMDKLSVSTTVKYYAPIKPASGWSTLGSSNYQYIGYSSSDDTRGDDTRGDDTRGDDAQGVDDVKENLMNRIKPSFWTEWIENNRDSILPGKITEHFQITHWSDTFVFPGKSCIQDNIDNILQWDMDYMYLEALLQSSFRNWVNDFYGYDCCGTIPQLFWNNRISGFYTDNPELLRKTCIIEGQVKDGSIWQPINGYKETLFQYKYIRLSENAYTLITQVREYVKKQNGFD